MTPDAITEVLGLLAGWMLVALLASMLFGAVAAFGRGKVRREVQRVARRDWRAMGVKHG